MSEICTITEQYHDQKDIYIWVVRIVPKVEKDVFYNLRTLAKEWDGYYSSFRGVNGFVFQSEEDAQSFVDSLSDYIYIPNEKMLDSEEMFESRTVESVTNKRRDKKKDDSKEKTYKKVDLTPSKMPLHEALREILDKEGKEILTDLQLINILDEYKAFDGFPSSKFILKSFILEGFSNSILSVTDWNVSIDLIITKFSHNTGIIKENIKKIMECLAYGLHEKNSISMHSNNIKTSEPILNSEKGSISKKVWSKKMNEEETDDFFLSITEYDKSKENEFGVSMKGLGFYVDQYNRLNITCEISKNKKTKNKYPSLNYGIFDFKDRGKETGQIGYFEDKEIGSKIETGIVCDNKPNIIGKIKLFWK